MALYEKIHKSLLTKTKKYKFLNEIIERNGIIELREPNQEFLFCIFRTIISQQISNRAAENIWKKVNTFIKKNNLNLEKLCRNRLYIQKFQDLGVSKNKIKYFFDILNGNNEKLKTEKYYKKLVSDDFRKEFKKFKGIGDWSCNMIEIFHFNRLDIWPHNDLIIDKVSKKIQSLENVSISFKEEFTPYQTILALHLWKFSDSD